MQPPIAGKGYKGIGMEGPIARWYASLTRKSLEEFQDLARRIAEEVPAPSRVLEVAPGPGYFAIELAKRGPYRIAGLDISHTFVDLARRNAGRAGVSVDFRHGNAAAMPFEDQSFDFLLCRAAFKNFDQPARALREMYRVLAPGGRALIIDLRKDASAESIRQAVEGMNVSRMNAFVTRLTFRFVLLKRAYSRAGFEALIAQTLFTSADIVEDRIGLEVSLHRAAVAAAP